MTREQAREIASERNALGNGLRYTAAKQDWRVGHHWYVKVSNGAGIFLASKDPNQ